MTNRSRAATRQAWIDRIDRFQHSSQTVAQFCAAEGVSSASFYHWRRKLRVDASTPSTPAKFVPVNLPVVARAEPAAVMSVELPGGVSVRIEVTESTAMRS